MSYVSLMFCFVCPARARPHANEAKVTKNILRIDQNEAKHKSLMFCFVVQQTNLIGQLGGYCNCTNETPTGNFRVLLHEEKVNYISITTTFSIFLPTYVLLCERSKT